MSALQRLKAAFGLTTPTSGAEQLRQLLAERESTLDLRVEYGEPTADMQDQPTAVFPYAVYDNGQPYSVSKKEFIIPDDGLSDTDAPLTNFVANRLGIDAEAVDFDALLSVEGTEADARLNDQGDVVVGGGA